jgi:secreted Zn-dependent insulinase-like peptidase
MSDIAIQEIYEGRFFTIQDRYDAIDKVKLDDLNEFISKIYSPKKLQFTGIGKIPEKELAKINTEL